MIELFVKAVNELLISLSEKLMLKMGKSQILFWFISSNTDKSYQFIQLKKFLKIDQGWFVSGRRYV